jgi:hypothetical protein
MAWQISDFLQSGTFPFNPLCDALKISHLLRELWPAPRSLCRQKAYRFRLERLLFLVGLTSRLTPGSFGSGPNFPGADGVEIL